MSLFHKHQNACKISGNLALRKNIQMWLEHTAGRDLNYYPLCTQHRFPWIIKQTRTENHLEIPDSIKDKTCFALLTFERLLNNI